MAHTEKILLRALDAKTAKVIRKQWVYNRYTAESFAADWHIDAKTRSANIYLGDALIYGHESEEFKRLMTAADCAQT